MLFVRDIIPNNHIETCKGKSLIDFDNLLRQLIIGRSNQVTSDNFADK